MDKNKIKILIFGGGAIGSHLTYCLSSNKTKIFTICRNEHYKIIKKKGLKLKIFQNNILKKKTILKDTENIIFLNNLNKLKGLTFDYIFITIKLKDVNKKLLQKILKYANNDTAFIPPCTELPHWWFKNILNKKKISGLDNLYLDKYKKNIIGMTMWLSGKIIKPGETVISHVQRGYPLKEIDLKMKKKAVFLRKLISKKIISPKVKNIYSEIYIKSINSFAFNLVALKTGFNNFQISRSKKNIKLIKDIINEFEIIVKRLNIPIYQTINSRVKQTLSSKNHTMSMLNDYNSGRKVEIINCWNNLNLLNKKLNTKTKLSEKTYNLVIKKIKNGKKNR